MKIEFKKVPQIRKELLTEFNSVKIEGTFCRISPSLVKIDAVLKGNTEINCCRCGITEVIEVDEELRLLLSDGIYKGNEEEYLVIEVEDSLIDFDEIIESELNSIKSDYYICEECSQYGDNFEKEF
ncbi:MULTISPECIES: hypothetical protein [Arcobacter]|jgi:uncharacterized metal-binding protein YceD (DUF177 family)|uniref:DUF177 domain-containing protein n=1 Tax=Arcobacter ellisii TaxID=913109 RepID=A0A347U5I4_9BACT|nr:hypothetical protein [Arcobacter ellisii]AXX94112.1 hypothetical protein AELL_0420 [Arcobacter ellisii]MBD3829755.1 hypothetical protein [Arcobacter sp.]RXI32470.1 hypothetical protein CP962_02375 [Arcobacter ellisii]